jgi:hypothetical protein
MHVSSTGSRVIFSPPRVSAAQKVLWYAAYAAAVWIAVALLALVYGTKSLESVQNESQGGRFSRVLEPIGVCFPD